MSLLTTTISPNIVNHDVVFNKILPRIKGVKLKQDDFLAKYIKLNHIKTKLHDHTFVQVDETINHYLINNTHRVDVIKQKNYQRNINLNVKYQPPVVKSIPVETSDDLTVNKILPPNYMDCLLSDLINLTSRMLSSLINLNDKSVPKDISNPKPNHNSALLTRYHSRLPPQISINSYLSRLCKFNNFNAATLLTTIYYIDLLSYHYKPYFTLNSWTIHRFLLVASTVSQKCMEDFFFTNDHYAKVGGVNTEELNCLELDFLYRVNWKCIPVRNINEKVSSIRWSNEVLSLYYKNLIGLVGGELGETDDIKYSLERGQERGDHDHEVPLGPDRKQQSQSHQVRQSGEEHDGISQNQSVAKNVSGSVHGTAGNVSHPDDLDYDQNDQQEQVRRNGNDYDYANEHENGSIPPHSVDNLDDLDYDDYDQEEDDDEDDNDDISNNSVDSHLQKSKINHIEEPDRYVGYDIANGSSPHLKRHYGLFE